MGESYRDTNPCFTSFCKLIKIPSFAWYHVSPPWKYTAYGGRMGPSAESSMEEPCTNAPAAITTSESYPGIAQGTGVT